PKCRDRVVGLGQDPARAAWYKEAAHAHERFLIIAPRTDADRRARIRGLIDFLRYLGQQSSLYDLEGSDRTVVEFENRDNRPIVKVRINASKDFLRFVLDTGSGMSVLSEETARKLGIRPVAHGGLARAVGGGGRFEIVYGYLSSVDIGEVRVANVPVYIRHFFDDHNPVDGYLGIAALGRLVTSVDYGTQTLTLIRQRNNDPDLGRLINSVGKSGNLQAAEPRPGLNAPGRTTATGSLSGDIRLYVV